MHKRRNVLGHLPQSARPSIKRALDEAWNAKDATRAQRLLENLARSLEGPHPGAAASLREGLEDTLTLLRIGVKGTLLQSLRSTNAIESLNDKIASYTRRVKQWQGGKMILRWVGAAILERAHGLSVGVLSTMGHPELLVDGREAGVLLQRFPVAIHTRGIVGPVERLLAMRLPDQELP